jgi:hypothetical protein
MITTQISFSRSVRVPRRLALLVMALAAVFMGCSRNATYQTSGLVTANNTITQAADETRVGWYPDQPLLDPATVGSANFGRLFKTQLQPGFSQEVLAQPLVVGGKVLVVTEANNLYLVDALTGAVTNSRSLGPGFDAQPLGCGDVVPTIGITGTPVVDVTTNTAYFYSKSSAGAWTFHAVSTADLSERAGFPVTISGTAQNDPTVTFNPAYEGQRPGLLLMNGVVYAGFGSQCDVALFRGWIVGVTTSGVIRTMFTTVANAPNVTKGNGIWGSGAGLSTDAPGQILFATGNGYGNPYTNPLPGNLPPSDFTNAVGRVVLQADNSLKITDFFAPYNDVSLSGGNLDLSGGGVVVLPSQFGTSAIPHLAIAAGKGGTLHLLNRDHLGGFQQGPNGTDATLASIPLGGSTFSRPSAWPAEGGYVYVTVNGGTSTTGFNFQVFNYGTDAKGNPTLTLAGKAPDDVGAYSGSPIVTSNGMNPGSALVWMTSLTAELRVYDAVPVNGVLNVRFRDWYGGNEAKFTTPGVGAGAVYVGTADGYLVGWGAHPPSVSGSQAAFGTVGVHQSKTLTAKITANQNVTVNAFSSSNAAFVVGAPSATLPAALTAGQSISVPVTFTPTDTISYVAALNVTTSSTPGALTLSGLGQVSGPHLAVSPTVIDYGGIAIGTTKSFNVSLSNNGTGTLTFSGITGPAAPYSVSSAPANGATLAPGASTTVTVTFAPTATGTYTSSFVVGSDGGNITVSLTGLSGTPANLVVTPLNVDFGTVPVGTTKTLSFTLQNTGGIDLTISLSKPPVLGSFAAQTILAEGSTIAAGQTVTETVQFTSSSTGIMSDEWKISGNDSTGLHTVTFAANSVAALPRTGWVATASATAGTDVPAQAIDSSATTRWSTGLLQSGAATQTFTLDMLSPQTFSMISMESLGDYARVWELYASDNTANWGTAIATGTATMDPVIITFPTQTHRYLQIRQLTSAGAGSWWSIYDLIVYGIVAPVSGPYLAVSPNPLDFDIATGTSKSLNVTLSNLGSSSLTFSGITGPTAPFSVSGAPANGATLAAGASMTLTVTFAPTANGSFTSSLAIGSNGGNITVPLAGISGAPPNLVVTPLNNDFGTLGVGTSKTMSFALQNTGGVDLTITTSNPPALGAFVAQTSLPVGSIIPAGQTVTETVQFTASATGIISDQWQITGNDSTGPHTVTFTANSVVALSRTGWVATASATGGADVPALAIDSAGTTTRWTSGQAQSGAATQTFTLDMLSPQTVSMIRMDSGGDYARVWALYASDSTASWGTPIATGTATADPVIITFPTQTQRYLQIRQLTSAGTGSWWSIEDLNVYGSTSAPAKELVVSPTLDFGSVTTGTSKSLNLLLSNMGTSPLTFSGVTAPAAPFSVTGAPANGATLAAGASTTMTVAFAPTAAVAYTSSLVIGSDGGNATVSLTGLGGAPANLVVAPLNNDFGSVVVGTSKTMSFILQNTGGSDLTITTSNPPAHGAFVAQTSLPVGSIIPAGQSVTETVQFASSAAGTLSDVWQVGANDATGLHSVAFTAESTTMLSRTGWVATASATGGTDVPAQAIDSAGASTRWTTGQAQSGTATQWFTVDMQTAQTFNQIKMDSGGDYVRSYQVFVSADGVNWGSPVATGSATANPVVVTFASQTARFIQVQQVSSPGTGSWWSIDDFNVIAGAPPPKTALSRTGWAASASATNGTDVAANAIDISTATRWSTGQSQSGAATQWFTLDMTTPQTFSQITMDSGGDYARNWQVFVSSDGTNWGAPVAMGAATANPITISLPSTTARYIQIRQTTSAGTGSWWSIDDLNVNGP